MKQRTEEEYVRIINPVLEAEEVGDVDRGEADFEEDFGGEPGQGEAVDTPAGAPVPDDGVAQENAEAAAPAPAPAHQPRARGSNREVGAKKAKAIARKEQQRAYNEFLREQGDVQRAEWARDEEVRNEKLMVEKARRAAVEARYREKEREERDSKRQKEEAERREEIQAVKAAAEAIRERLGGKGYIDIGEVGKMVGRSEEWVKVFVKKEGILGVKGVERQREVTMLTKSGWIVHVGADVMDKAYTTASKSCTQQGTVTWEQTGRFVQNALVKG